MALCRCILSRIVAVVVSTILGLPDIMVRGYFLGLMSSLLFYLLLSLFFFLLSLIMSRSQVRVAPLGCVGCTLTISVRFGLGADRRGRSIFRWILLHCLLISGGVLLSSSGCGLLGDSSWLR